LRDYITQTEREKQQVFVEELFPTESRFVCMKLGTPCEIIEMTKNLLFGGALGGVEKSYC